MIGVAPQSTTEIEIVADSPEMLDGVLRRGKGVWIADRQLAAAAEPQPSCHVAGRA